MRGKKGVTRASIPPQQDNASNVRPETNKIENSGLHAYDAISVEALVTGENIPLNSNGSQPMKVISEIKNARRSARNKISTLPGGTSVAKPSMEHVNTSTNYKDAAPHSQPISNMAVGKETDRQGGTQFQQDGSLLNKWEEKIDYLVQAVDAFKTKVLEQPPEGSNEDNSSDFSYKSLYLDAQKKVDALIKENFELSKKLEYARGKVAAYQEMNECANATKEVLYVRAADAAGLTPQTFHPLPTRPTTAAPSDATDLPIEKGNSKKRKTRQR